MAGVLQFGGMVWVTYLIGWSVLSDGFVSYLGPWVWCCTQLAGTGLPPRGPPIV